MKSEYLSDGCGGWRKPFLRCYVGGGTGVYAVAQAWVQVASGMFDTAVVVCEEKMSTCQPHPQAAFLTIFDPITEQPLKPNLLWIFALEQTRYMETYGITVEEIARDLFNGDAVRFHVAGLFQSKDPEQIGFQGLFGDGIKDRQKRCLRMRLASRHLFFADDNGGVEHSGGDLNPSLSDCVHTSAAADVTSKKRFSPSAAAVGEILTFHVHPVESVRRATENDAVDLLELKLI